MRPTCGSGRDERPWRRINSDVLLISILTWMYVFIGEYYGVGWEEKDEELDLGFALCPISRIDNSRILRRAVSEWPGSYSRRRRCTRPDPFVSSFFITAGGPMNASRRDKPREACPFCRLTWDGCFRPHTKVSSSQVSINPEGNLHVAFALALRYYWLFSCRWIGVVKKQDAFAHSFHNKQFVLPSMHRKKSGVSIRQRMEEEEEVDKMDLEDADLQV